MRVQQPTNRQKRQVADIGSKTLSLKILAIRKEWVGTKKIQQTKKQAWTFENAKAPAMRELALQNNLSFDLGSADTKKPWLTS